MKWNPLVPELNVSNFEESKKFYTEIFGFELCFERKEDRFGYFDLNGAQVMLQEGKPASNVDSFHFQVEVPSINPILDKLRQSSVSLMSEVIESWYRQGTVKHGQREFYVKDIDGYLYRFYEYIGEMPAYLGKVTKF